MVLNSTDKVNFGIGQGTPCGSAVLSRRPEICKNRSMGYTV
jgi:hypothetical protein